MQHIWGGMRKQDDADAKMHELGPLHQKRWFSAITAAPASASPAPSRSLHWGVMPSTRHNQKIAVAI